MKNGSIQGSHSNMHLDVNIEDFVNPYYLVQMFRNAYKRVIEPLVTDHTGQKLIYLGTKCTTSMKDCW